MFIEKNARHFFYAAYQYHNNIIKLRVINIYTYINTVCFVNRLVGRTGERDDRHDMEDERHLVSRTARLQSHQVFTGNTIHGRR